ncbi:MAG TPA: TIGR03032 family protein [Saprospiraceae bacterium]|nr:TIGR03032 family protein [Saprospiraceae bacterium]
MTQNIYSPLHCTYSPNVPALLTELECSLALTTYQAGKLIILSPLKEGGLIQLPRNFKKAMGLAVDGRKMAIATKDELIVLANASGISFYFPPQPGQYDALFVPRACYYTGEIDIHDMHWGKEGLYAVVTAFSCIALMDDQYSFTPVWKPNFIHDKDARDHCHLNGMAMENDKPKYVTAFGKTNTNKGWRNDVLNGGIVIDTESHEIIISGLSMPHSPRIYDGNLFLLTSATGELVQIDRKNGKKEVVTRVPGFARGMCKWGDYLFICLSRIRKSSSVFRDLPIRYKDVNCGVEIIHLPTGMKAGHIRYENDVEELYDIQILHSYLRPGILNHTENIHKSILNTPDFDLWKEDKSKEKLPI